MKNLICIAAVALMAVPALGAVATFESFGGDTPGTDTFTDVAGVPAVFDISVTTDELTEMDTVQLLIGWNESNDVTFEYSEEFNTKMGLYVMDPVYDPPPGHHNKDVLTSGVNFGDVGTSILVGTLTLDTTGLLEGFYDVVIDGLNDSKSKVSRGADKEPVVGGGTIHIIPEPASLMLLGLGASAFLRRRR